MGERNTSFPFGFPELEQRGDYVYLLYERDEEIMLSLGFSSEFKTNFRTAIDAFKDVESDEYWKGVLATHRDKRDEARNALARLHDLFQIRLKVLLGNKSSEFRSFRFAGISQMNEEQMVRYIRGIVKTADGLDGVIIVPEGETSPVEELRTGCQTLDDAIDNYRQVMTQRDAASLRRVSVANELYGFISQVCDAGKKYWKGLNDAYYNDFVLYGSSTPLPDEEEEETPADGGATDTTSGDEPVA